MELGFQIVSFALVLLCFESRSDDFNLYQSVITEAQALAGKHPLKNFALAGSCDGGRHFASHIQVT